MDFNSYKKVISNCNHIVKVGMVSAYTLFRRKHCPSECNRVHGSKSIP